MVNRLATARSIVAMRYWRPAAFLALAALAALTALTADAQAKQARPAPAAEATAPRAAADATSGGCSDGVVAVGALARFDP